MADYIYPGNNYYRKALSYSYGGARKLSVVKACTIHSTGNKGDTAKNNCDYFATGNTRGAGAHFFVDRNGLIGQSVPINLIAYHCGDTKNGKGKWYYAYNNANTIGIELCDCENKYASDAQIAALRTLIAWIKSQCQNIERIITHGGSYDGRTGKACPTMYYANRNGCWDDLKAQISGGVYVPIPVAPEKLDEDGVIGRKTVRRWQQRMGTPQDGVITGQLKSLSSCFERFTSDAFKYGGGGSTLIRAWQWYIGAEADGYFGPDTIQKTRIALNLAPEGGFDRACAVALQKWLNE